MRIHPVRADLAPLSLVGKRSDEVGQTLDRGKELRGFCCVKVICHGLREEVGYVFSPQVPSNKGRTR